MVIISIKEIRNTRTLNVMNEDDMSDTEYDEVIEFIRNEDIEDEQGNTKDEGDDDENIMSLTYSQYNNNNINHRFSKSSNINSKVTTHANKIQHQETPRVEFENVDVSLQFERTGKCNKRPVCKYSHKPEDIRKYRKEVAKRLNSENIEMKKKFSPYDKNKIER